MAGVKMLVTSVFNAEKEREYNTSSHPNNKLLLLLSHGTNFISDTQLNVAEKYFALNL